MTTFITVLTIVLLPTVWLTGLLCLALVREGAMKQ